MITVEYALDISQLPHLSWNLLLWYSVFWYLAKWKVVEKVKKWEVVNKFKQYRIWFDFQIHAKEKMVKSNLSNFRFIQNDHWSCDLFCFFPPHLNYWFTTWSHTKHRQLLWKQLIPLHKQAFRILDKVKIYHWLV